MTKAFSYEDGGDFARVICFQHVKRGYEKNMSLAEKDSCASLKKDILVLQEWSTQLIFSTVSKLSVKKWEPKEFSFIRYFKKQWLSSKTNDWYQGYAFGIPDHNNAKVVIY